MAARNIPSRNGPPSKTASNPGAPNQTLYCISLPDKLNKDDLRLSLYTLFSTYGTVLDVVAMKTKKMRGQAHVVFRDVQASTQAMRALQGFDFFGKEMRIVYAKGNSNIIAKLRGTYEAPTALTGAATSTDLQKSIFNAPPSSMIADTTTKVPDRGVNGINDVGSREEAPQGVKRPREDESGEEDAPMEEDDSDAPMEASSDED